MQLGNIPSVNSASVICSIAVHILRPILLTFTHVDFKRVQCGRFDLQNGYLPVFHGISLFFGFKTAKSPYFCDKQVDRSVTVNCHLSVFCEGSIKYTQLKGRSTYPNLKLETSDKSFKTTHISI